MSNLKSYLASKYMSGPKADAILAQAGEKKKKRKRKNEDYVGESSGGGGLVLKDEDEWGSKRRDADEDDEDAPVLGKEAATFKKGKSAWATVGSSTLPVPDVAVKQEPDAEPEAPKPQLTKRRGGLRTAAQMAEEAARAAAERSPSPEAGGAHTQTVHRDQTGRVLDVEALKAKAKQDELDEQRKAEERKGWTKGLVQQDVARQRAAEERRMATADVARHADDERMNAELKEVERWDDPALRFGGTTKKKKGPKYPTYKGAWPENRFGIAPGYRWDGVDRSNGFEKKWIQAQNTRARNTYEANKWSMEDM